MPLGFDPPHPGGMAENSPTFQRWGREFRGAQVPKGRLKPCAIRQPSLRDLSGYGRWFPTLKRWAIIGCPSGTKTCPGLAHFVGANPSGIGPSQLPQDRRRMPQNGSIPGPVGGSSHVGPCPAAADTGPGRASDRLTGGPDRLLHALTAFLPALADCQPPLTPILLQPCPPSTRPLANGGHVWGASNTYTQNDQNTCGNAGG